MEIKRIQLRGISRSPSDRMTDDGGVAESLNALIIDGEVAPINEPIPCNEDFGLSAEPQTDEPVYIHKTNSYEHIISYNPIGGVVSYLVDGKYEPILSIKGLLKKITNLGNTLIVISTDALYYTLFKDGKYTNIDLTEDTLPKLSFVNINQKAGGKDGVTYDTWSYEEYNSEYGVYPEGDKDEGYKVINEKDAERAAKIWDSYRTLIDNNLSLGCFSQPIMLRYGIRLYDGSYLWVSSPIMLGSCLPKENNSAIPFGNFNDLKSSVIAFTASSSTSNQSKTYVQLSCPYKIGVNIHRTKRLTELKDFIASIDVFLSAPIDFAPEGRNHIKREFINNVYDEYWDTCCKYTFDPANSEDPKKREEAVLAASNFFLIKSYPVTELPQETDVLTDNYKGENLFVKPQLDDSKVATLLAGATAAGTYNGRLLATGIEEYISRGIGVLNGQCANAFEANADIDVSGISYAFAYHIPNLSIVIKDHSAKAEGITLPMIADIGKAQMDYNDIKDVLATPYAWITHPNPNCTKVTIKTYSDGHEFGQYNIDMKPHPYLPCSYAFLGIGERIFRDGVVDQADFNSFSDTPVISRKDVAAFSNVDNPFVFQPASKLTFNREIKGFAIATDPMSTGQFGKFPLYFFLSDGIWTVDIANDGNFGSQPTLISRDVCLNTNSITPTKKAIFFMSDRGLLYISGSVVENISERMHGKAYRVPESLRPLIEGANFSELISDESVETFNDFMKRTETRIAYDYVGQRLICFNSELEWQYVFSMKTNTWHRAQYGKISTILNAYPRCVVTTMSRKRVGSMIVTTYMLNDLSISYDENAATKKIIIATRPFDLDEPDVFKTITDARVRGQYARGAVKFILLGSNDGIHFSVINTLRGKSWKLFRLIILADLDATDRISWVDIGYETRFTNKLR